MEQVIHFSHANGFPSACYEEFFNCFPQPPFRFTYLNKTAHAHFKPSWGWHYLQKELAQAITLHHRQPVVGLGHSMGGVLTLLTAQRQPHLYSKIILLDPPIFGPAKQWFMLLTYVLGISGRYPPASRAKKRRTFFESRQEALSFFAAKPLFKHFTPTSLANYVQHGLLPHPSNNTYYLAFDAKTEYRLFCTTPARYKKLPLTMPAYLIYSTQYEVLWKKDLEWIAHFFPTIKLLPFNAGHLFPFEKPLETAQLVQMLCAK
ncbi:MAG TPA: alpha/beta hydrolase [Chitinophagales bacterium]|nr:alpha/beta hydrolase [Chitinophagales bacterium]